MLHDLSLKLAVLGGTLVPALVLGDSSEHALTELALVGAAVGAAAVIWRQIVSPFVSFVRKANVELDRVREHVDVDAPRVMTRLEAIEARLAGLEAGMTKTTRQQESR